MIKVFYLCIVFILAAQASAHAERITISFSSLTGTQSPLWVAKERGFFKNQGLDVDLLYIVSSRVVAQTLMSGDVKVGFADLGNIVRANLAGGDLVLLAVLRDKVNFYIVSQKEITNLKQLRGKRIGIGQFGGTPDYTTRMLLEKFGYIPDKDIKIVQMVVGQGGRLAALQAGAIESIVINPPLTLVAKKLGYNLLVDYSEISPPFIVSGLATTKKYLSNNSQTVEKCVKAVVDAVDYILSNEEGTIEIIARYMKITDRALLKEYYRELVQKEISRSFVPDVKAVEFFLNMEGNRGAKADPKTFIDSRILEKLKLRDPSHAR